MEIRELAQELGCTPSQVAAGTVIGMGTWTQRSVDGLTYMQIDFPAGISYARFDPTFSATEYNAGIRAITIASTSGNWAAGYVVPAGVRFHSRNLALNKTAADAVKVVTGM